MAFQSRRVLQRELVAEVRRGSAGLSVAERSGDLRRIGQQKIEYDFMDFGSSDIVRVSDTGAVNHRDNTLTVNVLKVGASYHF